MRRRVGAEFSQSQVNGNALSARSASAPLAPFAKTLPPQTAHETSPAASAQSRINIARLFIDLRAAMRMTPHQVAAHLQMPVEAIAALESGHFEYLPPGPQTAHVIMAYTALAGIDGRPVLSAISDVLRASAEGQPHARHPVAANGHPQAGLFLPVDRPPVERLRQAGSALANGAKRLPAGAIRQVRERPERAFYAVSLPLGIVLLLLNTASLQAAFDHVPRPVSQMAQSVRQYFQEHFAPVREGLRWIEVDDPRRRRGDKLR